jgi:PKD repeat protein
MDNRTGILCIFVYSIIFIAAFSIVLLENVGTQENEEFIAEGNDFDGLNDATLETGFETQGNANVIGNKEVNGNHYPGNTVKQSPQPLNQGQQIANAGLDQTVNEGVVVQFNGTGSYDPFGTIESYEWDFNHLIDSDCDGNYTNDIDAIGPTPTHIYGDDGIYNVTLTVRTVRTGGGSEKVDQDVVLIIDSSGSMKWNDPDDIRIDAAKHYVYMLTPDDRVAVVDFDSTTELLQKLTMNYYQAMLALDLIDSSGGTKLSPALDTSITELEDNGYYNHTWAIILLTDAENLAQSDRDKCYFQANRAYNDSIVIYTIGLNIDTPLEQKLLEDIANITGGKYYSPPNASHLYLIYENISEQVENTTSEVLYDSDDVQITVQNVAPVMGSYLITGGDEGIAIDYDSTASDPGSDDLTFTWNWGDGTSDMITIYYNDGVGPDPYPSPWGTYPFSVTDSVQHTYGDDGIYTITLTVEDDDLDAVTKTQNVTINNVVPTINFVSIPVDGDEGALLSFSSTATDPGSDDLTFTWNWGDGTSDTITIFFNDGVGPDPYPSPWGTYPFSVTDTVDHIYGDNGNYSITLTVEDDDGGLTENTTTVTIKNVAPTINSLTAPDGDEGVLISFSSVATDQGSDDLTFTWTWGDGTSDTITIYYNDGVGPDPYPSPWGTYPFSATDTGDHTYGDNGNYTITLTVEDDDKGITVNTTNVTISNVAPTIDSIDTPDGEEGALISFSSTATDPGSDDLTFTWNWGDGTSDTVTVYYNNGVGPDPFPSPWGTYPFSVTDTVDHTYGDNGVYTITLTVEDDDGGKTVNTTTVTISNVAPTIDSLDTPPGDEGAVITFSSTATDPGSDDLTFTWNWGDGTSDTITKYYNDGVAAEPIYDPVTNEIKSPWGTYPFSATDTVQHTYGDNWNYTITLTIEDDDGGVTTKTQTVEIYNVAPTIDFILVPGNGDEGALLSYSSSATDPGSDDLTFTWNWGDGTSDSVTICYNDGVGPDPYPSPWGTFPFSATDMADHIYGDNWNYTITLTIEDDDGGVTANTKTVTIHNVAPSVDIVGSLLMYEGSPVDLTANSTDPGSDDLTFTWEFELGPTIVHVFYNDGIGPDPLPSPLGIYPFTVIDTSGYLYGDNGNYTITITVEDDDGGSTTKFWTIEVQNVAPTVEVEAYALVNFTLRIAGEKWHDVRLYIYEDDVEVGYAGVVRYPGSPDDQSVTISNVKCHVTAAINATVYYTPDDDPINGQRNGANPCWIKIGFEDGSYEILKHTFNVMHPETWEWNIGMNHYFVGHKITFKAEATDPGSDDLTFEWTWGDGSPIVGTTYYNDGLGPDPYPSPWGTYPCGATEMREHTYTTAGNYNATLTVTDDDGGIVVYILTINLS